MKKIILVIIAVVFTFTFKTLKDAGVFRKIENYVGGKVIETISGIPGPEDMDIDKSTEILYISSSDRWNADLDISTNGIYQMKLPDGKPRLMPTNLKTPIKPHGISLYRDSQTLYLFVVNHNNGDFVERFQIRNDSLIHEETFHDPLMCCPNDVAADGKRSFYVTNDHGFADGFGRVIEDYLRIPKSYVLYFDGVNYIKVIEKLNYANGIAISNDKTRLYVTETTSGKLNTLLIKSGSIEPASTMKLYTGVDNIYVDTKDNLWIGAHPKLFAFVAHAKDPEKLSPSEVLKLTPDNDGFIVQQVYLNEGKELSGSSVALWHENEIFVGGVFQSTILRIELIEDSNE